MERGRSKDTNSETAVNGDFVGSSDYGVSMSKIETTVLTPYGDVLVCRDRNSKFMSRAKPDDLVQNSAVAKAEDAIATNYCDEGDPFCGNPCSRHDTDTDLPRTGLLGGALDDVQLKTRVPPASKENMFDDLSAPPSFDYSQYEATSVVPTTNFRSPLMEVPENEELEDTSSSNIGLSKLFGSLLGPEQEVQSTSKAILNRKVVTPDSLEPPQVMHGVPTCLPGLSEIRISKISANPLGSHVLLISAEALLFSYGLNDTGQLGLGTAETFIRTPTLVTAVLEAGGKTISCAAGVDNSLIVVKTDGQRVRSLRDKELENEGGTIAMQRVTSSVNNNGKIQMTRVISSPSHLDIRRSEEEDSQSGGAVMFHHQVYGFGANQHKKLGLINPPLDERDHLNLPHRVALSAKVWPDETASLSRSLPPAGVFQVAASVNHSAALVRRGTGDIELYTWGETRHNALAIPETGNVVPVPEKVHSLSYSPPSHSSVGDSITYLEDSEYPANVTLGPNCTFIITSTGRCITVGTHDDGMLGIGKTSTMDPVELVFTNKDRIASVSVGSQHAFATSQSGNVYTWGRDPVSGKCALRPELVSLPPTAKACAGFDASAYVGKSGLVQTCGLKSGRLGQGEVPPNLTVPAPLFGGLRLWNEHDACPKA
mmetsp:Transcript_10658/g.16319  ORF Transcript_10658/g.16319 Transcript_10658/m.16319 type:complete len:654 (-) Transcript_10658:8-1969(-)